MLKICLLPRGGLPLSGSSERLKTLGVEKVEKTSVCHAGVISITVRTTLLFCKGLSELSKTGEMHIEFPGSILVALHT